MSDDERAIRELVDTWMAATKAGDRDTVLDLISDDALFIVAGREPFGKDEFAAAADAAANVRIDGAAEVRELRLLGDWAYVSNHITVEMSPRGGEKTRRSGYTLTILRKEQDGRWRLFRDANLVSSDGDG